jgi:flagella basal body P-ring formation protein FlgA
MSALLLPIALLLAAAPAPQACVEVEGDQITAGDLARAVPAFSSVPADTELGYAPLPGVRRYFHTPELRHLALRHNVTLPDEAEVCVEHAMETLQPERVVAAMRQSLEDPEARIEIVELSRYPVPRGELVFSRANLPLDAAGAVIWRGVVRSAGGRRFGVWANVKLRVRGVRVVATENLAVGHVIGANQVKLEACDVYPARSAALPSLETVAGTNPRNPIPAGESITASMVEAPREVERGDVVQVEVQSGAALLKLEGRAESAGRHGEPIKVHQLVNGRSFSARVAGKDRVVVATTVESNSQDAKP